MQHFNVTYLDWLRHNPLQHNPLQVISVVLFWVCGLCGCTTPQTYHCQTELRADGSVDRALLQPLKGTPVDLFAAERWEKVVEHQAEFREELQTGVDIRQLVSQPRPPLKPGQPADAQQVDYIAAWKRFPDVASVPSHYELKAEQLDRTSRFERKWERRDFGLGVEYIWNETLTEIISLPDALIARRELAKSLCDQVEFVLKHGLGEDYDASALATWLRGEGTEWFEELCEVHLQSAMKPAGSHAETEQALQAFLVTVCRRHGLEIVLPQTNEKAVEDAFKKYTMALFQRTVRRRDGQPLAAPVMEALPTVIGVRTSDEESSEAGKILIERLEHATSDFESAYPGGADALKAKRTTLSRRVWGLHGGSLGLFDDRTQFNFQLRLPGELIATNGNLQADGQIRWSFTGSQAFPLGYTMQARTIERRPAEIPELSEKFQQDRRRLVQLAELVDTDNRLRHALQKCRADRSLKPLHQHRDAVAQDAPGCKRCDAVIELLTH